ncbi:hypothetical protein PHLCEN_2v6557 [Hermanssonia centrifuga]|uniref:Protein AF-9 homolog n=1 Tax=Hermanssonia centrifuga TaxID=98765 RepID=A0A2R6NZ27_9APHY|nr:hypothetical protein PHLCEN_2v6557 [Hermanssonia centrifuga]
MDEETEKDLRTYLDQVVRTVDAAAHSNSEQGMVAVCERCALDALTQYLHNGTLTDVEARAGQSICDGLFRELYNLFEPGRSRRRIIVDAPAQASASRTRGWALREKESGLSIFRPIIYGNTAVVLHQSERDVLPTPDHTHRWTVAVRSAASAPDSDVVGGADDLSYFIKRVTFKLHDTYTNPNRKSGEKAITFYHHLKLHPWTVSGSSEPENPPLDVAAKLGPVHSWQYDEIVFNDPFQSFLNILIAHPPTPLPKNKRKPVPFHTANPASLEASKGGVPEFTQEMEKEEAERLESARKAVIVEQDKWREILIEKEKELSTLQRQLIVE